MSLRVSVITAVLNRAPNKAGIAKLVSEPDGGLYDALNKAGSGRPLSGVQAGAPGCIEKI